MDNDGEAKAKTGGNDATGNSSDNDVGHQRPGRRR